MWRAFCNDALSPISMAPIDPGVSVGLVEEPSIGEEIAEASASSASGEGSTRPIRLSGARILQVKDTDFRVPSAGHDAFVSTVWHKLDGEDVCMVTCADTGVQGEGFGQAAWIVTPDVELCVIRPGSQ